MSIEVNKSVISRYYDLVNQGALDALVELVDTSCRSPNDGQFDVCELQRYLGGLRSAFPDMIWRPLDMMAEGNRVMVLAQITGTHLNPLGDLPPTGTRIAFEALQAYRVSAGKLCEHWRIEPVA